MAAVSVSVSSPPGLITPSDRSLPIFSHSHSVNINRSSSSIFDLTFHYNTPLQATRRTASNPNFPQDGDLAEGTRKWARSIDSIYNDDDDAENFDDDDDDEEDRSLDLLVKFVQNVFKKISKRAKRAVRSVLPPSISSKLVGFSVNGVLVLAFLWVLKAFLEFRMALTIQMQGFYLIRQWTMWVLNIKPVVCTLGSVVFVSILLVRGIWTGVMYLQDSRFNKLNGYDADSPIWSGTRPAT